MDSTKKVDGSITRANKSSQCGSAFSVGEEIVVTVKSYSPKAAFDSEEDEDDRKMTANNKVG